jgi:hypothetical protein
MSAQQQQQQQVLFKQRVDLGKDHALQLQVSGWWPDTCSLVAGPQQPLLHAACTVLAAVCQSCQYWASA